MAQPSRAEAAVLGEEAALKVLRVFNNNVVLARDADRGEVVAIGRAIGFGAKPGRPVDPEKITQVFIPDNGRDADNFANLVAAIPPEYLNLAEKALASVADSIPKTALSTTIVALADHLAFTVQRRKENIELDYPLATEVSYLYPDELAVARRIVGYVNQRIDVPIPGEEAVSIALHLVNAGFATGDLSYTYKMTGVFSQLFAVLEKSRGRPIDRDSVNVARFITHVRYFFVRAQTDRQLNDGSRQLESAIRSAYPEAYHAAVNLQAVLELRLGIGLTEDEVTYLTLHVARMFDDNRA